MIPILQTPGPTPIPERVQRAMQNFHLHHRSPEFSSLLSTMIANLKTIVGTTQTLVPITASATGAGEAVAHAFAGSDGLALVLTAGRFSERLLTLVDRAGGNTIRHEREWGSTFETGDILELLKVDLRINSLWLVHVETSTATINDVKAIATAVREKRPEIIIVVDTVSSIGIEEFHFDSWNIDVAFFAGQKGLMSPPGLSFVALSERAIDRLSLWSSRRSLYFDLIKIKQCVDEGFMLWTPPFATILAVREASSMILQEGLEQVWKRHKLLSSAVHALAKASGCALYSSAPANGVTALHVSQLEFDLQRRLLEECGILVERGQENLSDSIIRIGHMGYCFPDDILRVAEAFDSLSNFGDRCFKAVLESFESKLS